VSEQAAAAAHGGRAARWPRDAQYGDATPGKIGMWVFLLSDAFSFAGLLTAYAILRSGAAAWRQPGEPALGVAFTACLTVLLMATSVTNVLAWAAAREGRPRRAAALLGITALGGALFLAGQLQEWWGIWSPGLLREGLAFGSSARASSFYAITGYHGLHVAVGVVYLLAVRHQVLRGRAGNGEVELLGLYWCFVDFVWVFVFSFLYLFP
jgi:heme/copper-type cytochrome/quinol oxidase subunit 3